MTKKKTKVVKNPKQIVTIDNGNGLVKGVSFDDNQYYTSTFLSKYSTGRRNLSMNRGSHATYDIDPAINGNTQELYVTRDGTTYHLGLSAHTVGGTIVRETGFTRYSQETYMENMFLGTLKGLYNGNWRPAPVNDLYLCMGIPPKWFYDDAIYNKVYEVFEKVFLDKTFSILAGDTNEALTFHVKDLAIMSEAVGGYYDEMYDEGIGGKFGLTGDPSQGTLVVDIGYGTLDCAIIKDFQLGSFDELTTDKGLGCHRLFSDAVATMPNKYDDFDELELLYFTGKSRLDLSKVELIRAIEKVIPNYLTTIRSHIARRYVHALSGYFSKIIVMGGITKICTEAELLSAFDFDGITTVISDEHANARGFDKIYRDELGGL